MKKMMMILAVFSALQCNQVYAASLLACHVSEIQHPGESTLDYDLSAPLTGDNGKINMPQAKTFDLAFGIETFISSDLSPGKPVILVSVSQKNNAGTTAVGVDSVMTFFDTTTGSIYIKCSLQ
jgi:hypothetical protein